MKQLLFLLLFPCLALAQYPGNGNQKITLGEQTSADGLVYRGLAADTTRKPSVDTMAFILLDTNTNIIWQYKKATNNAWTRVGGSISSGVTGVLPVANGGTNTSTLTANKVMVGNGTSGVLTPTELHWNNTNKRLGIGTSSPMWQLDVVGLNQQILNLESYSSTFSDYQGEPGVFLTKSASNTVGTKTTTRDGENLGSIFFNGVRIDGAVRTAAFMRVIQVGSAGTVNIPAKYSFYTSNGINSATERLTIASDGNIGIGAASPAVQLHTTGGVRFAGLASITDLRTDADGDLFNGSDFNLKNSIDTINFGLSDVMKLKPVSFNWNDEARNINEYKSMGFIAQDVMNVIPNAASSMGDGDMQVDYNAIVATLTKAIQEQQALIKALEQRILTLENK